MKRKLIITAEYIEEWDENEDPDFHEGAKDYKFSDWEDCDWDNVGRPIDRLVDVGWVIKKRKLEVIDN